ncbi:hypothetical protein F5884DRAFT_893178 [Xylogone sp. PMI_703]|nr:hypothetical protein F5884DRAFT_893178 [Xylogone sp. PMI_703]
MEITDPSLGTLSLLPAEIRIRIWKYLTPYLHVGRSIPKKPSSLSRHQNILLISRKIYAEIVAEVPSGYNDDTIRIAVDGDYRTKSWIRMKNSRGVHWVLDDLSDAVYRGFCDLPWHKLKIRVWIGAPQKWDRAEMICLYKKVQALVEILKRTKMFLSLWVAFSHTENASWFDDAKPQSSIETVTNLLPWERVIPAVHWDYQFIFPLFLQLRNVKKARMYSVEILKEKRENRLMSETFTKAETIMMSKTPYELAKSYAVHIESLAVTRSKDAPPELGPPTNLLGLFGAPDPWRRLSIPRRHKLHLEVTQQPQTLQYTNSPKFKNRDLRPQIALNILEFTIDQSPAQLSEVETVPERQLSHHTHLRLTLVHFNSPNIADKEGRLTFPNNNGVSSCQ